MTNPNPDLCRCGDSYCADRMPAGQDRSDCCQNCGYHDCDVCGWTAPTPTDSKPQEN